MNKIALLCPSRERSDMFFRSALSVFTKADKPDSIGIFVGLDGDDPERCNYTTQFPNVFYSIFMRNERVGAIWNALAFMAIKEGYDYLLMHNDDCLQTTQGWDVLAINSFQEEFKDNIGVLYGSDGINENKHCAFPFLHKDWINILGYYTPTYFKFFQHDSYIQDIAKTVNRLVYQPRWKFNHEHWTRHRVQDATTKRNRIDVTYSKEDKETFKKTEKKRKSDAEKLIQYIKKKE